MSTKYLLPCSCGQKIAVRTSQAGGTVRCACGAELQVPTMRGITALDPAAPAARTRRSTSKWGRRERRLLLGIVITIGALGLAACIYTTRPKVADVHGFSPIGTWAVWEDMRRGADRYLTPPAKQFAKSVKLHRLWTIISLGVAGLGALVTASAMLTPKYPPVRRPQQPQPGTS